jgi:hypothetical protein
VQRLVPRLGPGPSTVAAIGLAALILPDAAFASFAVTEWEVGLLRMLGLVSLALAGIWPWAAREGEDASKRLYRWSMLGGGSIALYIVTSHPLYLILFSGMADLWVMRAHVAAEIRLQELKRRMSG